MSDFDIAKIFLAQKSISISRSLVNQISHVAKFKYLATKMHPLLKEKQFYKRKCFSYSFLASKYNGENYIFSDESRFILGSDKKWVWRRRGQKGEEIYSDSEIVSRFDHGFGSNWAELEI